jgi:hypothetical protein
MFPLPLGSLAINFLMILMLTVPFSSWFPKFIIVYWNIMANFVLGTSVTLSVDNQVFMILVQTVLFTSWFPCNHVFVDSSANCSLFLLVPLQKSF